MTVWIQRLAQAASRQWRSLRRFGRRRGIRVVFHPLYCAAPTLLPVIDTQRARNILAFLVTEKLVRRHEVLRPRRVRMDRLRRVHTEVYLDALTRRDALTPIYGVGIADRNRDRLISVHRSMAGGTLLAALEASESGDILLNLGGGFHHAHRDRGEGFCIFNDIALAVDLLRGRGLRGNLLVVDLDLHDGDGTRSFFAEDESVFTFSLHNHDLDHDAAVGNRSIALGAGVGDELLMETLRRHLPPLVERLEPSLVFYIAGVDPAHDDKLGNWEISSQGMQERDRFVVELMRERNPPVPMVILLGGGYGPGAWRYTARFASWLFAGKVVEPAGASTAALEYYRRLTRFLQSGAKRPPIRGESEADWTLGPEDLPGHIQPRPHLLLGRYSLYGIELMADRYGLLEALRRRGFGRLRFDFDLDNPAGQTVRLLEGEDRAVLVELRLARDPHTLRDATLLRIEWLLLQNPRAEFDEHHPPLPGQKHPGLGLLRDIVSLLILACQDLQFDGVVFAPAHYHIAVQTERIFHFLNPRDEAVFLDLQKALSGLSLPEASRRVEEGRVRWRKSGKIYCWNPQPMLLPVGHRLRRKWPGKDYARQVARERKDDRFELV